MESSTQILPPPPRPRDDSMVMVVRRRGEVLARWALPARVCLGRGRGCDMELPVGMQLEGELTAELLPGTAGVQVTLADGNRGRQKLWERRAVEFGEPVKAGQCSVAFYQPAPDGPGSAFDANTPTMVLGPQASSVEQDLVATRFDALPRIEGGTGLEGPIQSCKLGLASALVRVVVWLAASTDGSGRLAVRVAAAMRDGARELG